jgi:hypothetical protein
MNFFDKLHGKSIKVTREILSLIISKAFQTLVSLQSTLFQATWRRNIPDCAPNDIIRGLLNSFHAVEIHDTETYLENLKRFTSVLSHIEKITVLLNYFTYICSKFGSLTEDDTTFFNQIFGSITNQNDSQGMESYIQPLMKKMMSEEVYINSVRELSRVISSAIVCSDNNPNPEHDNNRNLVYNLLILGTEVCVLNGLSRTKTYNKASNYISTLESGSFIVSPFRINIIDCFDSDGIVPDTYFYIDNEFGKGWIKLHDDTGTSLVPSPKRIYGAHLSFRL